MPDQYLYSGLSLPEGPPPAGAKAGRVALYSRNGRVLARLFDGSDVDLGAAGQASGADGRGVGSAHLDAQGHLIITLIDGQQIDAGDVVEAENDIQSSRVTSNGQLELVRADGTVLNAGSVVGPAGPAGAAGPQGPQGPAGGLVSRTSVELRTLGQGTVALAPGYRLLGIRTTSDARLRLYADAASQTADVNRTSTTEPPETTHLVLDFTATDAVNRLFVPPVDGFTADASRNVPYTLTADGPVVVTLTYVATEA